MFITGVKILGVRKNLAILDREIAKVLRRSQRGLTQVGNHIMKESRKVTPMEFGNLRQSGYVVAKSGGREIQSGNFVPSDTADVDRMATEHEQELTAAKSRLSTHIGPAIEIGYSAYYFPYVHEMSETNHFTTPNTGPKFLENAIKNNLGAAKDIFARYIKYGSKL